MKLGIPTPLPEPRADLSLTFDQVSLRFSKMVAGEPEFGYAPYYHFRVHLADGSNVGHLNFRVGDSEHVRLVAGHIGYEIAESFRGHGYAYQACRAIAPFVRRFYASVIITSDPDNAASVKTIERLGCVFLDEVPVPPHEGVYRRGSGRKKRYAWKP